MKTISGSIHEICIHVHVKNGNFIILPVFTAIQMTLLFPFIKYLNKKNAIASSHSAFSVVLKLEKQICR